MDWFSNSLGCPLPLGLSHPFTFRPQVLLAKIKRLSCSYQERFEPTTHQLPTQLHNQFTFMIIPKILGLYYHASIQIY